MTIVHDISAYKDYPFENIPKEVREYLTNVLQETKIYGKNTYLLALLECYLQITGQKLTARSLENGTCSTVFAGFAGALNSNRFASTSLLWRYERTRALLLLVDGIASRYPLINLLLGPPSCVKTNEDLLCKAHEFEKVNLVEEKVWLWSGWSSENLNGKKFTFRLYPIYRKLGRSFTQALFEIYDQYCRPRRSDDAPGLNFLVPFIDQYAALNNPAQLLNPSFSGKFWQDFFIYYVTSRHDNGSRARVETVITSWRNALSPFISGHLIKSGLFAEPWGELPSPPIRKVKGRNTNIRQTGEGKLVKTNLLTPIPLEVSDEQAIQLLFQDIKNDLTEVQNWAKRRCRSIWRRYSRRETLVSLQRMKLSASPAYSLLTKRSFTTPDHPDCLRHVIAVFAENGFKSFENTNAINMYVKPSAAAYDLGLPTSGALLPFCALLVAEHPMITPSFLEKLAIFDNDGKRTGLVSTDAGTYLIGYKDRRGPRLSQQKVLLNPTSLKIVEQILALTEVLRNYLKEKEDPQWRYLLLECGAGFSYPKRLRRLATYTSEPTYKARLISEFNRSSTLPHEKIISLVDNLSLRSIRASVATCIYLETLSVDKMAKALGHAAYSPNLLERYLPKNILDFFQERWVRIFQAGIIVESLKDSKFLVEASGFSCIKEIHEFLSNHALKIPYSKETDDDPASKNLQEVIFGVNAEILTALRSVQLTAERAASHTLSDGKCGYWARLSKFIFQHIEKELSHRRDLQHYVSIAMASAKAFET